MKKQVTKNQKQLSKEIDAASYIDFLEESLDDNYCGFLEDEKLLEIIKNYATYLEQRIAKKSVIAD